MVINAKISDALKTIGLNKYERNLWVALLARSSATAGELADISKVPRSRCYDVLESLADKGFVIVQPGKPMKYVAIKPREALERAKKKVQLDSTETCSKIDRLCKTDIMKELERVYKDSFQTVSPEELSGSLRGRYSLVQQTETMMKKARKYAKIITTEDSFIELVKNYSSVIQKMSKSGVKVNILAPLNKNTKEYASTISKYAKIRNYADTEHVGKMFARFFIVDGEESCVGLTDDKKTHESQDVAFWTQSRHVTSNTFEPMFNLVWHNSKEFK
ncbi:TrmB family transcriptional regulator [Candidatus Aenigmatarchaeota archaeon]